MKKNFSSSKLAEEYANTLTDDYMETTPPMAIVVNAFYAGWDARGKADLEIVKSGLASIGQITESIEDLDEQD